MRKVLGLALSSVLALSLFGCSSNSSTPLDPGLSPGEAALRVAHLSPDAPNVDVWVDGAVVLPNVPFTAVSDYLSVAAGPHRVQVTPAGATTPMVIDAEVNLSEGMSYTVAAVDYLASIRPMVLNDLRMTRAQPFVRFVHTSPDAPAVDVAVANGGPVLFSNIAFEEAGDYVGVGEGNYDLEVLAAGTSTVALAVPGVVLNGSTNYTIFAIGELGDGSLAALPVVDAP